MVVEANWVRAIAVAVVALIGSAGVIHAQQQSADSTVPHQHAKVDDGVTSMDVYAEGERLHLLVAERGGEKHPAVLAYRASVDGGGSWSDAVKLGEGQPGPEPARRGQDVQVAASGNLVVAAWCTTGTDKFGRGPIATAVSSDAGRKWKSGPNPSDDASSTSHAFIDVAADAKGTFHLVWIDGRGGEKGLRYARSEDGGMTWGANVTLVPITCECCWNTLSVGREGQLRVLYRQRAPRDMGVIGSDDGGKTWSRPVTVGAFGWEINGCPHVGGGLAISGSGVATVMHSVVWTAKDKEVRGAYVLSSRDAGVTWSRPALLGDSSSWHADIAVGGDRRVMAVWDAYSDAGPMVFASLSEDEGRTWTATTTLSEAGAGATHPRVVWTAHGFRVFWTQRPDGKASEWVVRKLEG